MTELNQTEARIREKESILQSFFESSPMMMGIVELVGDDIRHLSDNPATLKFFGMTSSLNNQLSSQLGVPPEIIQLWVSQYRKSEQMGQPVRFEYQHPLDQGIRWLSVVVNGIETHLSSLPRFAYVVEDTTEQKRLQQALHDSEAQFRDLYETAPLAFFSTNRDDHIVMANAQAVELLGYGQDELMQRSVWDLYPNTPDGKERACEVQQRALAGKEILDEELQMVRGDGRIVWVNMTIRIFYDHEGHILERRNIVRDISQKKQAEEALRESEERFRQFAEHTEDVMWVADWVNDRILYVNPAYERIWNHSVQELYRDPMAWVNPIHPEDRQRVVDRYLNIRKGEEFDEEYRIIQSDGSCRWIHDRSFIIFDKDGNPYRIAGYAQDFTDRKNMEMTIRQHNEQLEWEVEQRSAHIQLLEKRRMQIEKHAALAEITAGVAHEINNPLASIRQSMYLLEAALDPAHPHFEYIGRVNECINRMAHIVKNMFALCGPHDATVSIDDVVPTVKTAIEIMKPVAAKRELQICERLPSSPCQARFMKGELLQALCNLIQNSLDASAPGQTVQVGLASQRDVLSVFVADTGTGISAEVASHIFEPFYTTKNRQEGKTMEMEMGMGLSISRRLIEAMGGTIDFTTTENQGSTFTILLPRT